MKKLYCLSCPDGCLITVMNSGAAIVTDGNKCDDGHDFAEQWTENTARILTTTVRTNFPDIPVISVRTVDPVERKAVADVMHEINEKIVEQELSCGDILIEDVAGTGTNVIVTSPSLMQLGAELENKNEQLSRGSGGPSASAVAGGNEEVRNEDGTEVLNYIGTGGASSLSGTAGDTEGAEGENVEADGGETKEEENKSKEPHFSTRGRAQIR